MRSFPNPKTASVYHLPSSGTKSYPSTPDTTIIGAFLPLDRYAHALEGGSLQNPHEFYAEPTADIRVSDKVVIDDVTYYAKFIFTAEFGGLPHKRISISTE